MLGSSISIENMSHLANIYPTRADSDAKGYVDRDIDGVHPTQQNKKPIQLQLLFVISEEESEIGESLPRLASIRVPKGIPVAKIRNFIRYIEGELHNIYGKAKRLNFVMVADENSDVWSFEFDLPTFGVVYV